MDFPENVNYLLKSLLVFKKKLINSKMRKYELQKFLLYKFFQNL